MNHLLFHLLIFVFVESSQELTLQNNLVKGMVVPSTSDPRFYGHLASFDYHDDNSISVRDSFSLCKLIDEVFIFGGRGYSRIFHTNSTTRFNDLWVFNITRNQYKLLKGARPENMTDAKCLYPEYGEKMEFRKENIPGGRVSWYSFKRVHIQNSIILFGGNGYANNTKVNNTCMNDVWEYSINLNQWRWIGGSAYGNHMGHYGTLGKFDEKNIPPVKTSLSTWHVNNYKDVGESMIYFGGRLTPDYKGVQSVRNDLWVYCIENNTWAWIGGLNYTTINCCTRFDDKVNLTPSCRSGATFSKVNDEILLLFGGKGAPNCNGYYPTLLNVLADLWEYNTTSSTWKFISGSRDPVRYPNFDEALHFQANGLGSRNQACMAKIKKDVGNVVFLFFGGTAMLNLDWGAADFWLFNYDELSWKFIGGSNSTQSNQVNDPGHFNSSNIIGSRMGQQCGMINSETFYIFAGQKGDEKSMYSSNIKYKNDFWLVKGFTDLALECNHKNLDENPCNGNGKCTPTGCSCKFGYFPPFCKFHFASFIGIVFAFFGGIILFVLVILFLFFSVKIYKWIKNNIQLDKILDSGEKSDSVSINTDTEKTLLLYSPKKSVKHSISSSDFHDMKLDDRKIVVTKSMFTKKNIGMGANAVVEEIKLRGKHYAFKHYFRGKMSEENFKRELELLSFLRHENIIRFYAWVDDENFRGIIMEKGNRFYPKIFEEWDLKTKINMLHGIAKGMDYLHKNKILNRDLKWVNIVFCKSGEVPKIIDFDNSRRIGVEENNELYRKELTLGVGTLWYIAPEVFQHLPYTEKADVFSFSIMIYQCLFNIYDLTNAWYGNSNVKKAVKDWRNIKLRPKLPEKINPNAKWLVELLKECWEHEPHRRPTFDEICKRFEMEIRVQDFETIFEI